MRSVLLTLLAVALGGSVARADCSYTLSPAGANWCGHVWVSVAKNDGCSLTFPSGNVTSLVLASKPKHGRAGMSTGQNGFAYMPSPNYVGTDQFFYLVNTRRNDGSPGQCRWLVDLQIQ